LKESFFAMKNTLGLAKINLKKFIPMTSHFSFLIFFFPLICYVLGTPEFRYNTLSSVSRSSGNSVSDISAAIAYAKKYSLTVLFCLFNFFELTFSQITNAEKVRKFPILTLIMVARSVDIRVMVAVFSPCPLFTFLPQDCANFVSQILLAGGHEKFSKSPCRGGIGFNGAEPGATKLFTCLTESYGYALCFQKRQ
jgi:hypothetical protein